MSIETLYDNIVELVAEATDTFDECEVGTTEYAYCQAQLETLEQIQSAIEGGSF